MIGSLGNRIFQRRCPEGKFGADCSGSCACGSKWCFLCNKESGDGPGECPRGPGKGGCDEHALFLEKHDGWGDFAIRDENEAAGAQKEFLRRRMAFLLREVKNDTPPEVWAQLRGKHADLLEDVPTPGRRIDWDEIDTAELPLFGANRDAGDAQPWVLRAHRRGDRCGGCVLLDSAGVLVLCAVRH